MVSEDLKKLLFSLLCCVGVAAFIATIVLIPIRKNYMSIGEKQTIDYLHALEDRINAACSVKPVVDVQQSTITISIKKYHKLMDDQNLLECLRAVGVDNWGGYSEAVMMAFGEENE